MDIKKILGFFVVVSIISTTGVQAVGWKEKAQFWKPSAEQIQAATQEKNNLDQIKVDKIGKGAKNLLNIAVAIGKFYLIKRSTLKHFEHDKDQPSGEQLYDEKEEALVKKFNLIKSKIKDLKEKETKKTNFVNSIKSPRKSEYSDKGIYDRLVLLSRETPPEEPSEGVKKGAQIFKYIVLQAVAMCFPEIGSKPDDPEDKKTKFASNIAPAISELIPFVPSTDILHTYFKGEDNHPWWRASKHFAIEHKVALPVGAGIAAAGAGIGLGLFAARRAAMARGLTTWQLLRWKMGLGLSDDAIVRIADQMRAMRQGMTRQDFESYKKEELAKYTEENQQRILKAL